MKQAKVEIDKKLNAFGIEEEILEKSLNMLPILDLGSLSDGGTVKVEFLEDLPREIETPNSKFSTHSRVINVKEITLPDASMDFSMFLSSKSLALGINRIYANNGNTLKGLKAIIRKGKATYKDFGENICYTVQQIK